MLPRIYCVLHGVSDQSVYSAEQRQYVQTHAQCLAMQILTVLSKYRLTRGLLAEKIRCILQVGKYLHLVVIIIIIIIRIIRTIRI